MEIPDSIHPLLTIASNILYQLSLILPNMASPQDSRTVSEMGFSPLDPVDVPIGRMTVKLYPKITAAMPVHERAHAFQVNKSALKDLPTDF
jgi:hypothetical protein